MANKVSHDFVPNLTGRCDPIVEQAIRDLYLRFYKFNPAVTQNITQAGGTSEVVKGVTQSDQAYTITFTKDGTTNDGELSPSFTVNAKRDKFKPLVMSLTADGPPVTSDLTVNFQLEGVDMLITPLKITVGNNGPVTSTVFALPATIPVLKRIRMKIITSGGASQVVGEIVMDKIINVKLKVT